MHGDAARRGRTIMAKRVLIADDNFFPLQSTVVAEYRLSEG